MVANIVSFVAFLLFLCQPSSGQFGFLGVFPRFPKLPSFPDVPAPLKNGWSWLNTKNEIVDDEYSDKYYAKISSHNPTSYLRNSVNDFDEMQGDFRDGVKNSISNIANNVKNPLGLLESGRALFTRTNTAAKAYVGLIQAVHCLTEKEFTDPDLGSFSMNRSLYCNPKCGRALQGVLCCNPMTPDAMDVKLRLYLPESEDRSISLNFRNRADMSLLPQNGKIVFIVHGWVEKMNTSPWMVPMKDSFLKTGQAAAVIFVDWRYGNQIHYWQASANVRVVGSIIGRAILNWDIADRTLLVGFSLGAQIAGVAGKFTQSFGGGIKINECHGLDPAGPFFDGCSKEIMLTKSDCRLVQTIHTSAESVNIIGFAAARLGSYLKSGHCDYWINCGYNQGPCVDVDFKRMVRGMTQLMSSNSNNEIDAWFQERFCSHWRSPALYISALNGTCHYQARECPGCSHGKCNKDGEIIDTLPPFSKCTPEDDKDFYVKSKPFAPHCDA